MHRIDATASTITVSCDTCVMRHSAHCADCLLTHIVAPAPKEVIEFDDVEMRAMALLARAGMVPTLLHRAAEYDESRLTAFGPARRTTSPSWPPSLHVPGSPAPASRRPSVLHRARAELHRRAAAGLADDMAFTYRNPRAQHRPAGCGGRGARRSSSAPARTPPASRRGPPGSPDASPATPGTTTSARCAPGCGTVARPAARRRLEGGRLRRRQQHRRPRGRPTSPASAGSARTPTCCSPAPGAGSCSAAWSPRRRCPTAAAPVGRRLRHVPAVPRRLPDRGDRRARRGRRPALPGVAAAEAGRDPAAAGASALGDRLYGCDDCQDVCPPTVRVGRAAPDACRRPGARRSSTCSPCSTPTTPMCSPPGAAGTSPIATRGGCGATRSSCSATSPTRRSGGPRRARPLRRARRPGAAVHAIWAARRLGLTIGAAGGRRGDPASRRAGAPSSRVGRGGAMKHLLVTNDFPPKIGGIQSLLWEWWRRLPPDSFAVLTSPYAGAAAFDARAAVPHRARPRAGAAAAPVDGGADRRAGRATSAPTSSCSTRRCRSASSARRCDLPYDVVLHGAEVTVPGRLPVSRQAARRTCCATPATSIAAGELPGGRGASAPPAARCRSPSSRPASTPTASARSTTTSAAPPAARFGLPVDGELVVGVSRLVPRKGFDTAIRAAARLRRGRARPRRWRSPAAAATARACERLAAELRRPGALPRPGAPTTTCPALYGCADVFAMLCRNRWGGLEQEGFGIVFLEAAACGVPQVAGDVGRRRRGGRRRRDRASSSPTRTTVARSPRRSPACSTIRQRARRMGAAATASGPSPSSPTTCSPSAWVGRSGRCHDRRR